MNQNYSDINLYFNQGNLGLGILKPVNKLEVKGTIKSESLKLNNTDITNINGFTINNKDTSNLILAKEKSSITSNKFGINNHDPGYTFDIAGDFKVSKNIYGNNNNIIISHDESLNIDPESKYSKINLNNNVNIKQNLVINNNLSDNQENVLIDFNDNNTFNINKNIEQNKSISIYGQVDFKDMTKGVNIGQETKAKSGELYVSNKIKTPKIDIDDVPDKKISLLGDYAGNIQLGKYTYLSNLATNNESDQSLLLGHNLYADNDNIRIAETTEKYGYRGIAMNNTNGIQFYAVSGPSGKDNIPNLPSVTISNSGQLIHTIPVLTYTFDIEDLENDVYVYIRDHLGNKAVGSMMTFTTNTYLANDQVFNIIKNSATTAKCYIIDKKTNNVDKYFDVSLQ